MQPSDETTSHSTRSSKDDNQVAGYDETTSHSTRLRKDGNQVAGYKTTGYKMKSVTLIFSVLLMVISTMAQAATNQPAGEAAGRVGNMSGTLVVQRVDGTVNVVGPKSEVFAGDMLITAKDSYAQVEMNDGTKMTLRPNSNLRIESYQFRKEAPQADNIVLRL